jgi:hypothetical protein
MRTEHTIQEPPEDSIPLRSVVFLMAVLCVVASSSFVLTEWWMTLAYLTLIVTGSYLSYKYRQDEPPWLKYIWWSGILLVGANAMREFLGPLRDEFDMVSPFVHFIGGVFVFITFSMKTRSDLNYASGLGLMLLCLAAPVGKGVPYGCCVFAYLSLGAIMMYYDCISKTLNSWLEKPIEPAPEVRYFHRQGRRIPRGNTVLLLTVVPVAALLTFLYVPRADELLDKVWAYTKSMNFSYFTDIFYQAILSNNRPQERDHTARSWFNQNTDFIKDLPRKPEYERRFHKPEKSDKDKPASDAKKKDRKSKRVTVEAAPVAAEKSAKNRARDDSRKNKATKEADRAKAPGDDQPEKKEGKDKESKLASEEMKTRTSKAAQGVKEPVAGEKEEKKDAKRKDEPGAGDKEKGKKEGKKPEDAQDPEKNETSGIAPAKDKSKAGKDERSDSRNGTGKSEKGAKSGRDGKSEGSGKDGKGKSGNGGKGKNGKSGKPEKAVPPVDPQLGSESTLKPRGHEGVDDERIVMTVKSRRLVYLRRQCYDYFTGTEWKRTPAKAKDKAKDKKKGKETETQATKTEIVKVIDGVVKKEPRVVRYKAAQPVAGLATGNLYQPTAPGAKPGAATGFSTQKSVLASPQAAPQGSVLMDPTRASLPAAADAARVAAQKAQVEEEKKEDEDRPARKFLFETTERPIFKIGMSDALKTVDTLPTVELVQEIKVKAKSIGSVVPAGWIPQELRLKKSLKVEVDPLGVVTCQKPINRGDELKVRTELPIYPIEAMRMELPLSPEDEDRLRSRYKQYLQLPDTVTEALFKLAEDNADPRYNWFSQCQQICYHLRDNYKSNPYREIDPDCEDIVQDFLFDRKSGNCEDFASAFVIMTRCIGIPSRLVGGFSPGDHNVVTGEQEVKFKHRHAWAEAYIPQFGWVPFDPSPDGILPAQQRENRFTQQEVDKTLGLDKPDSLFSWTRLAPVLSVILAALISLTVGFVAFKVLLGLYKKWIKRGAGRGPEWRFYKRVVGIIKKRMRLTRESSETPTEFLERVTSIVKDRKEAGKSSPEGLPDALDKFLLTYSAVYFGHRKSEMENLRYFADEVVKAAGKVNITEKELASSRDAVRRPVKEESGAAASAVRRKR